MHAPAYHCQDSTQHGQCQPVYGPALDGPITASYALACLLKQNVDKSPLDNSLHSSNDSKQDPEKAELVNRQGPGRNDREQHG